MNEVEQMEQITEKVVLWQDHAYPHGYRPTLSMLVYPDGSNALELNVHGKVIRFPYTFPFMEKDRL